MARSGLKLINPELHSKLKIAAINNGRTTLGKYLDIALKEGLYALETGKIDEQNPERRFSQRPKK
jgi:hypothetical protein